jgi:uncharacterized protein YuzB (UPF0349 family)
MRRFCEELGDMDDCVAACQECAEQCRAMVDDEVSDDDDEEDGAEEIEPLSERIN